MRSSTTRPPAAHSEKSWQPTAPLAEPMLDTTGDFAELVFAMLGVAAKLERRRIAERTTGGEANARANGVKLGRKPSLTSH